MNYAKATTVRLSAAPDADERMRHDYPLLQQFHSKHALGALSAPSCLCCGQQTHPVTRPIAVQHMELPAIVVCKPCKDAADGVQASPKGDPDEAFRQHQRDRIAEARRFDAEQRMCLTCAANYYCPQHNPDPRGVTPSPAPQREVPPGKWKVDMPDGTYGRMPGDPPGPASVCAVIGGYVYDVEPRTGMLIASAPPTGYRLQKFNEEMQQRAASVTAMDRDPK